MTELGAGARLSHYRILEKIGQGGMGRVYRAWDERLERPVAIKLIGAGQRDGPASRGSLVTEARIASALNHPNICVIHEVGEEGESAYIVMELVEGKPLEALIPKDGLPVPTLLRYATQIADALAHAHDRGVVHQDLKNGNVVVTPEGRPKVLDFGLAKRSSPADPDSEATRSVGPSSGSGSVVGTLQYIAPEILRGEPADARSDLWAFGVMMYEMASGRRPFGGRSTFELTAAILKEQPAALPAAIPAGLRSMIQRCLVKEPGQRYQRAGEIRAALEMLREEPSAAAQAPAPRPRRRGAKSDRPIRALAVLPLENLSGDSGQDFFADGMTEALIAGLAKIRTLRVISRTSVMAYKGVRRPLPVIAKELKVDGIVEGSVLRSGGQVRITAQLVRASTDEHLWAETYDRPLDDILALQSEVARAIAEEIKVKLTPREEASLRASRTIDPAAYEIYLRGRFAWNRRTNAGIRQGIEYFDQAIEKEPAYALAYAGLADCYNVLGFWGGLPAKESFGRAKAAASRALELDRDLGEAHVSLAYALQHYDWDWQGAERGYHSALELNPGYATGHHFCALFHLAMGRLDEADAAMKKAAALDPLSRIITTAHGWILLQARELDRAVAQYRKALELHPDFSIAREWLGRTLALQGKFDESIGECRKAVSAEGSIALSEASLAHVLGLAGRTDEARAVLERLLASSSSRYVMPYGIAMAHAGIGELDQALDWLEKAVEERGNLLCYLARDPAFDALRTNPRFEVILRRVGLPARSP